MKSETRSRINADFAEVRRLIGVGAIHSPEATRLECQIIFDQRKRGEIGDRQWRHWLKKVDAQADPAELRGFSEATHYLLMLIARYTEGSKGPKLSRQWLTQKALSIICPPAPLEIPGICGAGYLKDLIFQQTHRYYTNRHYTRMGVHARKTYTRSKVQEILSTFPNYAETKIHEETAA